MDDLVSFLSARLDEDEAAALHVQSWDAQHEKDMPEAQMRECIELASRRERNYDQPWWAANMRFWLDRRKLPGDPARVLREVEAGRQLLALYEHASRFDDDEAAHDLFEAVRIKAAVYSDHPDYQPGYRPEWKP